jgi:RNA polymerase sigma factor (sigma-70 family)
MGGLEDEQLVVLAQECGFGAARDELICRCLSLSEELVGHYAARAGLQEADCQDAQQDAVLWIVEAIAHYRTDESVHPGGCRFRSFLHRVLTARLIDSLRHRRFLEAHFPLIEEGILDRNENSDCRRHRGATGGGPGPLREAEERELGACLDREVGGLGGPARGLWDLLVKGMRLRKIAAALNISYEAAKRLRRKLITHLRACLGQE